MFAVFENLQVFESRYEELNLKLYDPATAADRELYARLMKEHKEIEPIVETYRAWRQCGADLSGAKELLEEAADRELKEMAQQEIREKGTELSRLEEELKLLLLPKDPNDEKNVIVEIRGGAGGEEAALFATTCYADVHHVRRGARAGRSRCSTSTRRSWAASRRSASSSTGEGAYSRLKFESGVHRVQRVPETETQAAASTPPPPRWPCCPRRRRWTWRSTRRTCRSTPSAPAAPAASTSTRPPRPSASPTCPPAWWWSARTSAASIKNKDKAMKVLRARSAGPSSGKQDATRWPAERRSQVGTGDRSERIRTYNFPQGRVTDHRIGLTLYKLEAILDGDLDELIDSPGRRRPRPPSWKSSSSRR